jgi:hypothetical protein
VSKVRVIYDCNGPVYLNQQAYQMVETLAADYIFQKPKDFKSWPRWKRAKWLNEKMGHLGYKFTVIREPRNTRMSRSLFANEVLKAGGVLPEKKKKVRMRNGNRIELIDEAGDIMREAGRIWGAPRPMRVNQAQAGQAGGH